MTLALPWTRYVVLEAERGWLRVQPVDADGLPCAPSEWVPRDRVGSVTVQ